jgi:D-inositol-3-phosphate glycosyltransferase
MIAHLMTSVSRGGLELYVRELILKLDSAGLKQVVICNENSFMIEELRTRNIPVEFLADGSRYSLLRMARLRKIHRQYAVAIWQSHQRDDMMVVALAFFFRKIRHIFSLYMGFAKKQDLLHRLVYSRVEKLVTTSELMNSLALERLPVTPGQIACIRYGRETHAFKVPAAKIQAVKKAVGLRPGQKIVISLCRLDPMKGVREFADAAKQMSGKLQKKLVFVQIGERTILEFNAQKQPVYRPESEAVFKYLNTLEQSQGSGCRYVLLPFQKDFIPYLAAADYFVLGSYDEMYSLSLIDAMMAECLVIGTNNGGTLEQLAENRGMLIETKSAAAISEAITRAEGNPTMRKKTAKTAYAWAMREHSWKHVLPQWLALYNLR